MEVEKIIQYLLIGNLTTGKIIFEMSNTKDPKTIFDINQIFNTYSKKRHHRPENTKVESYNIMITVERIIMISKTDESYFSYVEDFDLFKQIKNSVPELSQLTLVWSTVHNKQDLNVKISNAINDYFNHLNNLHKMMNTISFNKNDIKLNPVNTKKYYNEEEMNMRNSLISNRTNDADKYSYTQMVQDKGNKIIINDRNSLNNINKLIKKKKVSIKIIDENNEQDKSNISKSLIRSSLLVQNNNNTNKNNIIPSSKISYGLLRELQNLIWHISCCKKIIFFFLIIIIIAQIVIIPVIIYCSYSY